MRIALVNRSDIDGGAGIAALRLFKRLRKNGINVEYLVGIKIGNNQSKHIHLFSDFFSKVRNLFEKSLLKKLNITSQISIGLFPFPLKILLKYHKIEIVHLNWVGAGFINIKSLRRLNIPIVWTIHDSWPFTGGCHIHYDCKNFMYECGYCPQMNSSKKNDLSNRIYKRKKRLFNLNTNITFVSPSTWVAREASKSGLLQNSSIVIIPNGIDTSVFNERDKTFVRNSLEIDIDKKLIVFGAVKSVSDINKGYHFILEVLEILKDMNIEVLVFGAESTSIKEIVGKRAHFIERNWSEDSMANIYSAADVTLVPSISETLSNVTMESLSCGTPVVAFRVGGIPDLIDHKVNGYLAQPYNIEDFANGVKWVIRHDNISQVKVMARNKILNQFDISIIAEKHLKLYESLKK